ncbi:MAG: APC family permease, partial [Brevibacterium yomogidense]
MKEGGVGPGATGLRRVLGLPGAVIVGVGSMVGAGAFAAFGPAAAAAGSWLLLGLAIAVCVAFLNATSTAQLAAQHPVSGGVYAYGTAQLGPVPGLVAGWGFVLGKIASTAAMALVAATYLLPASLSGSVWVTLVALLLLGLVTAVNALGVNRTVQVTAVLLTVVLIVLAVVVGTVFAREEFNLGVLASPAAAGPPFTLIGVLQSAGILFFAFAGYARIATLGEEVRDPARTIPRAIVVALGVTVVLYAVLGLFLLGSLGAQVLADSEAPVARLVAEVPVVSLLARIAAVLAALGALLGLTAGLSRTAFAMARDHTRWFGPLAHIHERSGVPLRAQVLTSIGG